MPCDSNPARETLEYSSTYTPSVRGATNNMPPFARAMDWYGSVARSASTVGARRRVALAPVHQPVAKQPVETARRIGRELMEHAAS